MTLNPHPRHFDSPPDSPPDSPTDAAALNPLAACSQLRDRSRCMSPEGGQLTYPRRPGDTVSAADRLAFESLRTLVLDAAYPCVMARSAFNTHRLRVATYGTLGSADNSALMCHDLYDFCNDFAAPVAQATSFIACFGNGSTSDEASFEAALWAQLQSLHDIDRRFHDWAPGVRSDPADPNFSFSIGGRAFFIIGMHPHAPRLARRTALPVMVFNLHEQFVALKDAGKFDAIRDKIQVRDVRLQGHANPMSADFGARSSPRPGGWRLCSAARCQKRTT